MRGLLWYGLWFAMCGEARAGELTAVVIVIGSSLGALALMTAMCCVVTIACLRRDNEKYVEIKN